MPSSGQHISEEALELYSLGILQEPELGVLEEHLLLCAGCQQRLSETDRYVEAARAAAARYRARNPLHKPKGWLVRAGLAWRPAWALALCGVVLAGAFLFWQARTGISSRRGVSLPPMTVFLSAFRNDATATAPAGRALWLGVDTTGLDEPGPWELEVVDEFSRTVGRFELKATGAGLAALVPGGLPQGHYWVRLYPAGKRQEPLREYALRVE